MYIEETPGKGWLYHVVGGHTVAGHGEGWKYETRQSNNIENSKQFYNKVEKGTIARDKVESVDSICQRLPLPAIMVAHGVKRRTHCVHWVLWAYEALEKEGIFKPK